MHTHHLDLANKIQRTRARFLEALFEGAPVSRILEVIALSVEELLPSCRCSILLVDHTGDHLKQGASPNLPRKYTKAIDGLEIGPAIGSCGACAALGERVIAEDVRSHPNWASHQELSELGGFRACWSQPILARDETVLGTFALYYENPYAPNRRELEFMAHTAQFAGLAIEHERALHERRASDEQLRLTIDLAPQLIFSKDASGEFLLANRAIAEAYGMTPEELVGQRQQDLHQSKAEIERMLETDQEVLQTGQAVTIPSIPFRHADGALHYYRTEKIPYTDPRSGRPATLGVAADITELKTTGDSLRDSELNFRQMAENIRDIFWLTDWSERKVLYVSPAYERIWGSPGQSLLDDPRNWVRAIHSDDQARVTDAFEQNTMAGKYDIEYRIVTPDGQTRWIHDRAFPIQDEDGKVYRVAGVSEDITERKVAEAQRDASTREKLRSLESDLMLAEEQERRRIAIDLHDGLSQTLTLAQMKLSALQSGAPSDLEEELETIQGLIAEADHATRSLTFELSPPILHDLGFVPAMEWLVDYIGDSYEIEVTLEADATDLALDERVTILLFRAVRELLINVAKHSLAREAQVTLQCQSRQLEIRVHDDGVAFDPEVIGRRGSGLSNIRERLAKLGGAMEIESVPASGTTVTLRTPLLP